jgi:hypothetical protein
MDRIHCCSMTTVPSVTEDATKVRLSNRKHEIVLNRPKIPALGLCPMEETEEVELLEIRFGPAANQRSPQTRRLLHRIENLRDESAISSTVAKAIPREVKYVPSCLDCGHQR